MAQFEKLWGDMPALLQVVCEYVIVLRMRGQQLKEPAQEIETVDKGAEAAIREVPIWVLMS